MNIGSRIYREDDGLRLEKVSAIKNINPCCCSCCCCSCYDLQQIFNTIINIEEKCVNSYNDI